MLFGYIWIGISVLGTISLYFSTTHDAGTGEILSVEERLEFASRTFFYAMAWTFIVMLGGRLLGVVAQHLELTWSRRQADS